MPPRFSYDDYRVGWICPLKVEQIAAMEMLDKKHDPLPQVSSDTNIYNPGSINNHNVVIAGLPKAGNCSAATVITQMKMTFPNLKYGLLVGIGGGVPVKTDHGMIRLGHVVVSAPTGINSGVVQYDHGKARPGEFERKGSLAPPPTTLLNAAREVAVQRQLMDHDPIWMSIQRIQTNGRHPGRFKFPGAMKDHLYRPDYEHQQVGVPCEKGGCDPKQRIERPIDDNNDSFVVVHRGTIASGELVIKDGQKRDILARELGVLCFEMEAAGALTDFPCIVIRGISDYCDSHKNDLWHDYAAAAAAAYARQLFFHIPHSVSQLAAHGHGAGQVGTVHNCSETKAGQCIADLRSTDPRHDKARIEQTKGGLLRDAYCWILDHPHFRQWRDDNGSRLLWIKGGPGKGKTMLLCGIVDELTGVPATQTLASFFFCQATDSRLNSATSVLRGLLYLLVDLLPSLASHIQKKYDHTGKELFEDVNAWFAISEIFMNILHDLSETTVTYLIVDALDECGTDLPKLLHFIVRSTLSSRVKWAVSSRNNPDIEWQLRLKEPLARLDLELEANAEPISRAVDIYIDDKVSQVAALQDNALRYQVRDMLRQKASGTFLWVALVVGEMEQAKSWEVLQMVEEVPMSLNKLYDRMMNQVQGLRETNREFCLRILSTATLAYRPLHLLEIGAVSGLPTHISARDVRELVAMCGSFLTVQGEWVYLVHQSAKDYLYTTIFPSGPERTHYDIFSRSLCVVSEVLRRDVYDLRLPGITIDQIKQPDPDPLASVRYSCVYWVDHLRDFYAGKSASLEGLQHVPIINAFLTNKYLYWLEALGLIRNVTAGLLAIATLESLIVDNSHLVDIVRDARRFILAHSWIIEHAPLQAYFSALVFSPRRCLIRKLFNAEEPPWLIRSPTTETDWSTRPVTLFSHSNHAVAYSPNKKELASGSFDVINIWEQATGARIATLDHSNIIYSIAYSDDSSRLASASWHGTIKIWDTTTWTCMTTLRTPFGGGIYVAYFNDSKQLISGSDGQIRIWDAVTHKCIATHIIGYFGSLTCSYDGAQLVSAPADGTIRIWNAATWASEAVFLGHDEGVNSMAYSYDSKRLASASSDGTVKIWDAETWTCLVTLEGHGHRVETVAYSHDSKQLASASWGSIKIWNAATAICVATLDCRGCFVQSVAFSCDNSRLASADDDSVKIWDLAAEAVCAYTATVEGHDDCVASLAYSYDGKRLASSSEDGTVKIWDAATGTCLARLEGHGGVVSLIAYSYDSKRLASASYDGTVKIWDAATGICLATLNVQGEVSSFAYSHDSRRLACASRGGVVRVWDRAEERLASEPEVWECLATLKGHDSRTTSLTYSHNDRYLASVQGQTVRIWNTERGACVTKICGHDRDVHSVAFSHTGRRLASASGDHTVKIWDTERGLCIMTLYGHSRGVCSVAFSHEGKWVASGAADDTLKIWDTTTGDCLTTHDLGVRLVRHISFDARDESVHTEVGRFAVDLDPLTTDSIAIDQITTHDALQQPRRQRYGLMVNEGWITWNSEKLLWLPNEYIQTEPQTAVAPAASSIAIGCMSGRVSIFTFSPDHRFSL